MFKPPFLFGRSARVTCALTLALASTAPSTFTERLDVPREPIGMTPAAAVEAYAAYAKLPAAFVENRGQADAAVRYYAQGQRYAFYLTRNRIFPDPRIPD